MGNDIKHPVWAFIHNLMGLVPIAALVVCTMLFYQQTGSYIAENRQQLKKVTDSLSELINEKNYTIDSLKKQTGTINSNQIIIHDTIEKIIHDTVPIVQIVHDTVPMKSLDNFNTPDKKSKAVLILYKSEDVNHAKMLQSELQKLGYTKIATRPDENIRLHLIFEKSILYFNHADYVYAAQIQQFLFSENKEMFDLAGNLALYMMKAENGFQYKGVSILIYV